MPDALLKLLVKDKPLYSGKVRERRETKLSRRNEVRADERQTGSGKPRGETEDNYSRQGPTMQHAKLAVETRDEITLQLRSTNQRKCLAVETPKKRELRLEC